MMFWCWCPISQCTVFLPNSSTFVSPSIHPSIHPFSRPGFIQGHSLFVCWGLSQHFYSSIADCQRCSLATFRHAAKSDFGEQRLPGVLPWTPCLSNHTYGGIMNRDVRWFQWCLQAFSCCWCVLLYPMEILPILQRMFSSHIALNNSLLWPTFDFDWQCWLWVRCGCPFGLCATIDSHKHCHNSCQSHLMRLATRLEKHWDKTWCGPS